MIEAPAASATVVAAFFVASMANFLTGFFSTDFFDFSLGFVFPFFLLFPIFLLIVFPLVS
ncbi:unnamed protein product [Meloidogyne enterolobii]|uniref:Uncharacterized protein n=1 Tax=Meloidogyne enterolobii TaxID=390850 RepID=A0ACB0ZZ58_MELEN